MKKGTYGVASSNSSLAPAVAACACIVLGAVGGYAYRSLNLPPPEVVLVDRQLEVPAGPADCSELEGKLELALRDSERLEAEVEAARAEAADRFAAAEEAARQARARAQGMIDRVARAAAGLDGVSSAAVPTPQPRAARVRAYGGPYISAGESGVDVSGSLWNAGDLTADVTVYLTLLRSGQPVDSGATSVTVGGGTSADYSMTFRWAGEGYYTAQVEVR